MQRSEQHLRISDYMGRDALAIHAMRNYQSELLQNGRLGHVLPLESLGFLVRDVLCLRLPTAEQSNDHERTICA